MSVLLRPLTHSIDGCGITCQLCIGSTILKLSSPETQCGWQGVTPRLVLLVILAVYTIPIHQLRLCSERSAAAGRKRVCKACCRTSDLCPSLYPPKGPTHNKASLLNKEQHLRRNGFQSKARAARKTRLPAGRVTQAAFTRSQYNTLTPGSYDGAPSRCYCDHAHLPQEKEIAKRDKQVFWNYRNLPFCLHDYRNL